MIEIAAPVTTPQAAPAAPLAALPSAPAAAERFAQTLADFLDQGAAATLLASTQTPTSEDRQDDAADGKDLPTADASPQADAAWLSALVPLPPSAAPAPPSAELAASPPGSGPTQPLAPGAAPPVTSPDAPSAAGPSPRITTATGEANAQPRAPQARDDAPPPVADADIDRATVPGAGTAPAPARAAAPVPLPAVATPPAPALPSMPQGAAPTEPPAAHLTPRARGAAAADPLPPPGPRDGGGTAPPAAPDRPNILATPTAVRSHAAQPGSAAAPRVADALPPIQPAARAFAAAIAAAIGLRPAARADASVADPRDPNAIAPVFADAAPAARFAVAATASDGQGPGLDLRRDQGLRSVIDRIELLRDHADARDTRIRLVPDALGGVDIAVRKQGDTLHVHFTADNRATAALLAEAQPRLGELAEARGIKLGQTSVGIGPGSGDGQARQHRQPGAPTPTAPPRADSSAAEQTPDTSDYLIA